jgi:hypothetical protein
VKISHLATGVLQIRRIDPFFADLLRKIPKATDPSGHTDAQARLFSKPMEALDPNFLAEWETYVTPDLKHLFQEANETVAMDIHGLEMEKDGKGESWAILIPGNHLDQWLNSLNQVRLVLATQNNFTEEDMDSTLPQIIETERELHLLQIQFYGYLQEVILKLTS